MSTTNNTIGKQVKVKVENSPSFTFADLVNCIKPTKANGLSFRKIGRLVISFSKLYLNHYKQKNLISLYAQTLESVIALMIAIIEVFVTSFNSTVVELIQETRDGVRAVLSPKLVQSPF